MLVGDLLGAVLVDGVVVAGDAGVVVAECDLLLTEVALALDALAVHPGAGHAQPDVAQQRLHPRRREHRVVDVVVGRRCQPAVAGRPGITVGVVEDHELQFGADVGHQPLVGQPGDLLVEDAARRLGYRLPSIQDRSAITIAVPGSHGSRRSVEKSGVMTMSP